MGQTERGRDRLVRKVKESLVIWSLESSSEQSDNEKQRAYDQMFGGNA